MYLKWTGESLQENDGKLLDLLHRLSTDKGWKWHRTFHSWRFLTTNVWWRSGNRFHLQVGFRSMERREKPKEKEEEELNRNPVSVLQSWSHTEGVCVYSAQLCQQKVWKDGREIHVKQFIEHSIHFSPKWVSKKPQLLKSVSTMNCCFVQLLRRHPSASQKMP